MHRLHEDDLAGHVLTQEPWEVVWIPAIADEDEVHQAETMFGRQSFRRKAGEVLHAEREPLALRIAAKPHRLDHAAALWRRCLLVLAGKIIFAQGAADLLEDFGRLPLGLRQRLLGL